MLDNEPDVAWLPIVNKCSVSSELDHRSGFGSGVLCAYNNIVYEQPRDERRTCSESIVSEWFIYSDWDCDD